MDKMRLAHEFSRKLHHPEIKQIVLFGSVARGEDREDSDIDILIISTDKMKTKNMTMKLVGQMLLEENAYFSVKVISPGEYRKLKRTYFISQIKEQGILLEGSI